MATVYRRGNIYWVRFQWRGQEIRKSARTTSKREARDYLERLREEYRALDVGGIPRRTFAEAAVMYIEEHVSRKKISTIKSYQQSLRVLDEAFGALFLDEIGRREIAAFEAKQLRRVSASKVKHYRAALSGIFKTAIKHDIAKHNPCRDLDPIGLPRWRQRFLTRQEWERLHKRLTAPLKGIAGVAVTRGMRLGEILSLRWEDLDFRRDEIHIRESKSGQPRVIPMEGASAHFPAQRGAGHVFRSLSGEPLRVDDVSKRFSRQAKAAGIEDFTFHDLRHTFASWFVQDGGDLYVLQRILGHSTPAMTQRYAHLRTNDLRTKTGTAPRDFLH